MNTQGGKCVGNSFETLERSSQVDVTKLTGELVHAALGFQTAYLQESAYSVLLHLGLYFPRGLSTHLEAEGKLVCRVRHRDY